MQRACVGSVTQLPLGHYVAPASAAAPSASGAPLVWGALDIGAGGGGPPSYLPPGFGLSVPYTAPSVFPLAFAAPRAGTLQNLFVYFNVADGAALAVAVDFTLRVNGVDTALTASRLASDGVGSSSDVTNTVAVAQGDLVAMVFSSALPIGGGLLSPIVSVEFV